MNEETNSSKNSRLLTFVDFSVKHFSEYQRWFQDELISEHLGSPVDKAWLDWVLKDDTGRQISVFQGREMVAVVGIVFPSSKSPACVISDMAVNPDCRGQGIGRDVLRELLSRVQLAPNEHWQAFVEQTNPGAFQFFKANNWQLEDDKPDEDSMFSFVHFSEPQQSLKKQ